MGNSVENAILRKAGVENGATAERAEIQGSEGSRWKGDTGKWNQQEKETEERGRFYGKDNQYRAAGFRKDEDKGRFLYR